MTSSTTLTARSPEDLLAMVPVVLGFVPSDSVVMLTFGAEHTFHARVDLPEGSHELPHVVAALLDPALQHRVRRVVFVIYSRHERRAQRAGRAVVSAFEGSGIVVVDALRADGQRWFPLRGGHLGAPARGTPYDVSAHRFLAQSVVDGRVTHGSRAELAATLAADPEAVRRTTELLAAHVPADDDPDWVRDQVARHVTEGSTPTLADAARLLGALADDRVRDVVCALMTRQTAAEHVRLWTVVLRGAPEPSVPAPAALLGFAAWLAGDGALAWCAIDCCTRADPDYGLAQVLAEILTRAVPPSVWEAG